MMKRKQQKKLDISKKERKNERESKKRLIDFRKKG